VGTGTQDTYGVGLTISATGNYLDFAKATLKDTANWEWTNQSSLTNTVGSSQSATLAIGGPAWGYTGGTVCKVYLDTIYNTFLFVIDSLTGQEVGLDGKLLDRRGKPVPFTEVSLVEMPRRLQAGEVSNNIEHRTFTNAKGEYRFLGHISGPARIRAQAIGIDQILPLTGPSPRHVQLSLP